MAKTISTTIDTQSPALAHLTDHERIVLRDVTLTRAYEPGEIIFDEGAPSRHVWFIEQGRVRLFKTTPDGHTLTVCIARTSDHFCLGTCPLFDGDFNPVSAQALESVVLKLLDKRIVEQQMTNNANVGIAFGKMMADRYRHFTKLTTALALHCIRVRVADALLCQVGQHGELTAQGIELDLDMTQEVLASCVGTDRAVIARTLLQFERDGILLAQGKHIILYNIGALEQLVNATA